jgi:hypothetical protein
VELPERALHPPAEEEPQELKSLAPGTQLLKFTEDETGNVTYFHLPVPLSDGSLLSYAYQGAKVIKSVWQWALPPAEDALEFLEDVPWE